MKANTDVALEEQFQAIAWSSIPDCEQETMEDEDSEDIFSDEGWTADSFRTSFAAVLLALNIVNWAHCF